MHFSAAWTRRKPFNPIKAREFTEGEHLIDGGDADPGQIDTAAAKNVTGVAALQGTW